MVTCALCGADAGFEVDGVVCCGDCASEEAERLMADGRFPMVADLDGTPVLDPAETL